MGCGQPRVAASSLFLLATNTKVVIWTFISIFFIGGTSEGHGESKRLAPNRTVTDDDMEKPK